MDAKRTYGSKAVSLLLSFVLAIGLAPTAAWGIEGESGSTEGDYLSSSASLDEAYYTSQVIVTFETSVGDSRATALMSEEGTGTLSSVATVDEILIPAEDGGGQTTVLANIQGDVSVEDAIDTLEQNPAVASVQPNFRYQLLDDDDGLAGSDSNDSVVTALRDAVSVLDSSPLSTVVDDPYANVSSDSSVENQWWLYSVNAFDAWDYARCDNSVTVAVIDTGINFDHTDLKDNIDTIHAYDAYADEPLTENAQQGHGTHVAGIVAAQANNAFQFAGVSYNANILPINVFYYDSADDDWYASTSTLVKAYTYLKDLVESDALSDLHVINMSLGGYGALDTTDRALETLIEEMNQLGVMTVCAGGNGDSNNNPLTTPSYPADFEACVSVISLQSNDARSTWSDYNAYKDISAPGQYIWSTYVSESDSRRRLSGTSMASPLVAGIAALLFASEPDMSVADAKQTLYSTAVDLGTSGWDEYYGWGKVDAAAALESLRGANILGQFDNLYVTQQVQLEAELYTNLSDDPAQNTTWAWSVDNPAIASIDENGVLTALSQGSVTVTVTAEADSTVTGTATYTVRPIALQSEVEIQSLPDSLSVSWEAAPAASGYELYRAQGNTADWQKIADIDASEAVEGAFSYADTQVSVAVPYYYKVIPYGMLGDTLVEGTESNTVVAMYKNVITSLEGATRYETMGKIVDLYTAERTIDGSAVGTVILATADNYPDALAASSLAGVQQAPIILVSEDELGSVARASLTSIAPTKVFVIGGEAAISAQIVDEVKELLPASSIRRLSGDTRERTALAIYDDAKGSWGTTAIIASSKSYADALSISSYAYATKSPILLIDPDSSGLSPLVSQRLRAGFKTGDFTRVIIVGGAAAVSEDVEQQISVITADVDRWAGETRYETSQVIAQEAVSEGTLDAGEVGIATGENFPDALAAGPLLGFQKNPLLLMGDTNAGRSALSGFLTDNVVDIDRVTFFGGTGAVSQSLRQDVVSILDLGQ